MKAKLEKMISDLETKVARRLPQSDDTIAARLDALTKRAAKASDSEKFAIQNKIKSIQSKLASEMYPSLAEVEEEIDRIYGDQSLNSTYYFSRKRQASSKDWSDMTLEEAEAKIHSIYGDQSKNETFYFNRGKEGSLASVPLNEVVKVAEAMSKYKESDYYTPVEMTPRDMYSLQDTAHPAREAAPAIGGYSTDYGHSMHSDSTHAVVDTPMHSTEGVGFGHNVRTRVEEAPHIREDSSEWDGRQAASLKDQLIRLGAENVDLQPSIKAVLDTILGDN